MNNFDITMKTTVICDSIDNYGMLRCTCASRWIRKNFINPVLPGDRPDPTVIEINGEYWAAATSNEWSPLFPIFEIKRFSELGIGELCFSGWST